MLLCCYPVPVPDDTSNSSAEGHVTWLTLARLYRGRSQHWLAEQAHFDQAQISRLEAGDRQPRPATAERLADALKVPADKLFPRGPSAMEAIAKHFGLEQDQRRLARRRRAKQARLRAK